MPNCKLCSSPAHTLKNCDSPLCQVIVETVTALINEKPFNIWLQVQELDLLTAAQLSIVCRSFHYPTTYTKPKSISSIICHFFGSTGRTADEQLYTLSQEETNMIDESYTQILEWPNISAKNIKLQDHLIFALDIYYFRRYKLKRRCLSTETYYHELQIYYSRSLNPGKTHLRRLQIGVIQHKETQYPVECCICLETNPPVKPICGHEICPQCIMKLALSRSKSIISCPLCRADIKIIYAPTNYKYSLELCFERS